MKPTVCTNYMRKKAIKSELKKIEVALDTDIWNRVAEDFLPIAPVPNPIGPLLGITLTLSFLMLWFSNRLLCTSSAGSWLTAPFLCTIFFKAPSWPSSAEVGMKWNINMRVRTKAPTMDLVWIISGYLLCAKILSRGKTPLSLRPKVESFIPKIMTAVVWWPIYHFL